MLKLYNFPTSPYGWIARMALAEKGLPFASAEPYDRTDNPELAAWNPLNRTPTLVCDGKAVFESWAILEFLEDRFPEPRLIPGDAFQRARARAIASMIYLDLLPEVSKLGRAVLDWAGWDRTSGRPPSMKPADQIDAKARDEALKGSLKVLGHLDRFAQQGPWLAGGDFSIADIVLTPWVTNLGLRGFDAFPQIPAVAAWHERLRARPSFAASKPAYVP